MSRVFEEAFVLLMFLLCYCKFHIYFRITWALHHIKAARGSEDRNGAVTGGLPVQIPRLRWPLARHRNSITSLVQKRDEVKLTNGNWYVCKYYSF